MIDFIDTPRMIVCINSHIMIMTDAISTGLATAAQSPLEQLARLLRQRREAAHLSRATLAVRAGLSESTLKNLESGRHLPTRSTLYQLCAVPDLHLDLTSLLRCDPFSAPEGPPLNCWLAPGFEPIKMLRELVQQINGSGGHIEQSNLYLDHMSAACWCAIADQEDYAMAQRSMPIDRAAAAISGFVGSAGIDVLGLGCGDAKHEVRLIQHLLEQGHPADLRLYLLDISQPLLSVAYKHAADSLSGRCGVQVSAVQGNFHHLQRYSHLLYDAQRAHRRRVICLFGGTFANLENELLFIRHSLVGFTGGDLLLVNTSLIAAPVDCPQEIHRLDPRLSGRIPPGWQQRYDEWLTGPLLRYGRDVADIEFSSVLDTSWCPVPGSYAVEVRARVRSAAGRERSFSLFRFKRHEALRLLECMKELGWDPVDGWRYGDDPGARLLYLFRRRG